MAADFVQHFSIATPRKERGEKDDTFQDAVEDPQTTQQNDDATGDEIERLQMERENQRQKSLEKVATEIGTMAGSSGGDAIKEIRGRAEELHRQWLETLPHRQYLKRLHSSEDPMDINAPSEQSSKASSLINIKEMAVDDEEMKETENTGMKRGYSYESKADMMKRAKVGEYVEHFISIMNRATVPVIKQQMIMQGIDFHPKSKK